MKNLNRLVKEVMHDLDIAEIPYRKPASVNVNTRYRSTWGRCRIKAPSSKHPIITIEISAVLLADDVDDMSAKDTIAHEFIHTVEGCMNHGARWKYFADKLNQCNLGYNIKRLTSYEEKGLEVADRAVSPVKYIITCPNCGNMNYYRSYAKTVKRIQNGAFNYACGRCRCRLCSSDVVKV